MAEDLAHADGAVRRHDRRPGRERLDHRRRHALVDRRQHEGVGLGQPGPHRVQMTRQFDLVGDVELRSEALQGAPLRPVSEQNQPVARADDAGEGANGQGEILLPDQPADADEQTPVGRPRSQRAAREGAHIGEAQGRVVDDRQPFRVDPQGRGHLRPHRLGHADEAVDEAGLDLQPQGVQPAHQRAEIAPVEAVADLGHDRGAVSTQQKPGEHRHHGVGVAGAEQHVRPVAVLARLLLGRDCPPIVAKVSNSLDRRISGPKSRRSRLLLTLATIGGQSRPSRSRASTATTA